MFVRGAKTSTRYFTVDPPRLWHDPFVFEVDEIVFRPEAGMDGSLLLPRLRLSSLHRRIVQDLRDAWMADPQYYAEPRSIPTPGRAGHPARFYAEWVSWYLDAFEQHGQRCVRPLLVEHRGFSASGVRRIIGRAEQLGLITDRRPGRAGGTMTAKCREILGEGNGR